VGGSGILASALGEELARRGHEAHFISYERPFRLPADAPRLFYHPVVINDYGLFKYPDYTLPLSVKMAEVSRDCALDVLHVHYAVPHATAAILARSMLPPAAGPGSSRRSTAPTRRSSGAIPATGPPSATRCDQLGRRHDRVRVPREGDAGAAGRDRPIDVIHNFFEPRPARRTPRGGAP
jgi:hypothetical protein